MKNKKIVLYVLILGIFCATALAVVWRINGQKYDISERSSDAPEKRSESVEVKKEEDPSNISVQDPLKFFGGTVSLINGNVLSVEGDVTVSKPSVPDSTSNESRITTTERKTVTCSISKETKFTNAQKEEVRDAHLEKGVSVYIEYAEKDNASCEVKLVELLSL